MQSLIIAEHNNKQLNPATRHVISAAVTLNTTITVIVLGFNCQEVVEEVSKIKHVQTVFSVDDSNYEHFLPEQLSQLVTSISDPFAYILCSASTFGKNCLPRIAALLDVGQVSDVTKIIDESTFQHPIYAGNALETVKILSAKKVLTIRPTAFDSIEETQPPCLKEEIPTLSFTPKSQFLGREVNTIERPDLTSAAVVVSGGRGVQSKQGFELIETLADTLNAAVGASRAAVDAGFAPNDYQVGQTGKIVAPSLYIAIGISGAIQHVAGMKDAKVIVAINKDENAPIFQIATYGLVGDLFELVPELINKLKH